LPGSFLISQAREPQEILKSIVANPQKQVPNTIVLKGIFYSINKSRQEAMTHIDYFERSHGATTLRKFSVMTAMEWWVSA
jgi:hypothetical protein